MSDIEICPLMFVIKIFLIVIDPDVFPQMQVDKGAIKPILNGANIMCRGLSKM